MSDEESQDETPKKKKPLLLIIVAANVLLGGGAAAFFFMRGDASAEAPAEGADAAHAPRDALTRGPMIEFMPLIVNLNEPEGARFLKISFSIEVANEKMQEPVEAAKPIIRDHFIRELSDLNFRQTMGNKNKLAIKKRLLKRLNEAVGTDAAVDVHITQFIVQ